MYLYDGDGLRAAPEGTTIPMPDEERDSLVMHLALGVMPNRDSTMALAVFESRDADGALLVRVDGPLQSVRDDGSLPARAVIRVPDAAMLLMLLCRHFGLPITVVDDALPAL